MKKYEALYGGVKKDRGKTISGSFLDGKTVEEIDMSKSGITFKMQPHTPLMCRK